MNIGIVGLGLIGGSLGLDLRSLGHYVWGMSRSADTCAQAVRMGAADVAGPDPAELSVSDRTDVVFICTPIAAIIPTLANLVPYLPPRAIVTDVGSVKAAIVTPAEQLWRRFVGGHPMAGNASQGIHAAARQLFHQRPCVLTPSSDCEALATLRSLWQSVGGIVLECSPADHDRAVAWISHLPVFVSTSLIQACLQERHPHIAHLAQQMASSGFRDTSRVGGGNPELGRLMAEYNQTALLETLHTYQQVLQKTIAAIEAGQWQDLEAKLRESQEARSPYVSALLD